MTKRAVPVIGQRMSTSPGPDPSTDTPVTIVYDGDCPFCSNYIRLVRLREAVGTVELVDARGTHPILDEVRARDLDLDQGMVVRLNGEYLHGSEAMAALSMLSTQAGLFNRVMGAVFRNPRRAAAIYPLLVKGRNLTLRLLRRKPIGG